MVLTPSRCACAAASPEGSREPIHTILCRCRVCHRAGRSHRGCRYLDGLWSVQILVENASVMIASAAAWHGTRISSKYLLRGHCFTDHTSGRTHTQGCRPPGGFSDIPCTSSPRASNHAELATCSKPAGGWHDPHGPWAEPPQVLQTPWARRPRHRRRQRRQRRARPTRQPQVGTRAVQYRVVVAFLLALPLMPDLLALPLMPATTHTPTLAGRLPPRCCSPCRPCC